MRDERLAPYRQRNVSRAAGRVLEIGIGSGENLPLYGSAVTEVIGLEPSARLAAMARDAAAGGLLPVTITEASAERMPLDAASFDTVVLTWTLCSIPDPKLALANMRRVLKPSGRLLFVEHGFAPERHVRFLQRWLTPVWKRLAGGCHLDRDAPALIADAGFGIERVDTGYMRGPRLLSYMYEGSAVRR